MATNLTVGGDRGSRRITTLYYQRLRWSTDTKGVFFFLLQRCLFSIIENYTREYDVFEEASGSFDDEARVSGRGENKTAVVFKQPKSVRRFCGSRSAR